jgi:hypothetical protein
MVTHPADSPELVPSHFDLFGHVKGLLIGESFETGKIFDQQLK